MVDIEKRRATQRLYYARNREKLLAQDTARRRAAGVAPRAERVRVIDADLGTAAYNKEAKQRYRDRNPERYRELNRLSAERHRARTPGEGAQQQAIYRQCGIRWRATERAVWVEPIVPLVVYELADGICGLCGGDVPPDKYEIDHVLSLLGGGEHSYENVQLSHVSCNRRKAAEERWSA